MAMSIDTSVVSPVLIGRTAMLASLESIIEQVRKGQGQLVYVSGEAGIGKSRLMAEVRTRFEQEQVCFLQGACFEQDSALPLSPLVDLLRTLLNPTFRESTLQKLLPFAPEIIKILPDLLLWLPDVVASPALEPEQEKRRLFVALANFLLEQAGQKQKYMRSHNRLANWLVNVGKPETATRLYEKILDPLREQGESNVLTMTLVDLALATAFEIENRHWMAGAYYSLGEVYLSLLDPLQAIATLEEGLKIARPQGSAFWTGNLIATLALAYHMAGDLPHAERLLTEAMPPLQVPHNLHERRIVWAMGGLALAQRRPEEALHLADILLASAPGGTREGSIPMLLKLRGEALGMLGQIDEAILVLEEAHRAAHELHASVSLWLIQRAIVSIYASPRQRRHMRRELGIVYEMIDELASSVMDEKQLERFL